jgi:hypothetical protein
LKASRNSESKEGLARYHSVQRLDLVLADRSPARTVVQVFFILFLHHHYKVSLNDSGFSCLFHVFWRPGISVVEGMYTVQHKVAKARRARQASQVVLERNRGYDQEYQQRSWLDIRLQKEGRNAAVVLSARLCVVERICGIPSSCEARSQQANAGSRGRRMPGH